MIIQKLPFLLLIIGCLVLAACAGGNHYAPVIEAQARTKSSDGYHIVSRGETLYSIAWRYNLDFRGLARTNGVKAPYTIYPYQKIRLKVTPKTSASVTKSTSKAKTTQAARGVKTPVQTAQKHSSKNVSKSSSVREGVDRNQYPFKWRWPAKAKVVRGYTFSSNLHKGIDLHGKLGEPVHAANSGKVVYAGSGLVGYGKLLIIKHDDHYLSAYGHNRKLLVKEGDMVKVGQRIAEFGDTGTDKVKLHFEIRRDGKPINPLGLLPKKG